MWTEERKQKQRELMKSLWEDGKLRVQRKGPRSTDIEAKLQEVDINFLNTWVPDYYVP